MTKTWTLIGSHGQLPELLKAISERFYYSPVSVAMHGKEGVLSNSKGILEGVRIVKKGKRYRFEMLQGA
jgi:hypothetical protein